MASNENCRVNWDCDSVFGLEFWQCSLNPMHHYPYGYTLDNFTFNRIFPSDALFTAPFRALLCYQRRLTLVGTEDVSTSGSFERSSYLLTRRSDALIGFRGLMLLRCPRSVTHF